MRRIRLAAAWLALAAGIAAGALWSRALLHFFGIDTQQSDNYDFWSGVGPCLISAVGLSTLIVSAWHAVNCHEGGCWRIGKHKVAGTPWCGHHHGNARDRAGASLDDVVARLDALLAVLEGQGRDGR